MKKQLPHWHHGLHALHFSFVSGLLIVTLFASIVMSALSPRWVEHAAAAVVPFSSASFWNTPVPAYTTTDTSSAAIVANIASQAAQFGSNFTMNGSAVYTVEVDTPLVSVTPYDCGSGVNAGLSAQWQAVPLPFFAVPSQGANPSMVIYQPATGSVWEFGKMRNNAGQWEACSGGRTSTSGDGVFPAPYGISSSGLAALGGQLTAIELKSGYIDHVIGLALPRSNNFVSPATQSAGGFSGAPAMGTRLRLDPSVDVQSLGLNAEGVTIARAAQTYGFIVWNTAGTVSVIGESPVPSTSKGLADPYAATPGAATALSNFPWNKLQALPHTTNFATVIPAITQFSVSQSKISAGSRVTLSWQSTNVSRCAVPGIGDNLPAQGTVVSPPLATDTTFVLRCGGSAGTTSSLLKVAVSLTPSDPMQALAPGLIIDQPYSGYANVLPELMSAETAAQVYKVVYYESETYLFETAKAPYALNTARMDNGSHTIDAQIYYRDGRTDRKSVGITVNNSPETLFAAIQSGVVKSPPSIPLPYAITGMFLALSGMALGSWWGWRKSIQ